MTAKGKVVTAQIRVGTRILVSPGRESASALMPAVRKTGALVATVTKIARTDLPGTGMFGTIKHGSRYLIETDKGAVKSAPAQTFWLAKPNLAKEENMTVTVRRGAGRPAATARAAKAAQETPLPDKPAHAKKYIKAVAAGRKGAVSKPRVPTPDEVEQETAAARPARKAASKADKPVATKPAAKKTQAGAESVSKFERTVANGDFPGAAKINALLAFAAEHGWSATLSDPGHDPGKSTAQVEVSRGEEVMTVVFTDGKLDLTEMPVYMNAAGRSVKLKNVSAVKLQMSGAAKAPVREPRKGSAPRAVRPKDGSDKPKSLPFDPDGSSDEEVLDALRGHAISWRNGISKAIEEAVVAATRMVKNPDSKNGGPNLVKVESRVKIEEHPERNTRVVTFTDATGRGFHSVALDRILEVK